MFKKAVVISLLCAGVVLWASALPQQGGGDQGGENLEGLLGDVFSTPTPSNIVSCTKDGQPGECISVFLCSNESKILTDGRGFLDIRFNEDMDCPSYMDTCCFPKDILTPARLPEPEPEPGTGPVQSVPIGSQAGLPQQSGAQVLQPEYGTIAPPVDVNPMLDLDLGPKQDVEVFGCGVRNVNGVKFRISGGTNEAEFGEFPWMAAILRVENIMDELVNVYQCGGSLIAPNVVLTAAHCIHGKAAVDLKVRLGEYDTQTQSEPYPYQDYQVAQVVTHEEYNPENLWHDVGLLILEKPAVLGEHVNTICLPPQNANFDLSKCAVSGWGKDVFGKEGRFSAILKKIELPILPHGKCQDGLRTTRLTRHFILDESFICAGGEEGLDTCTGDGGSPLVCPIQGTEHRYYQVGAVAWGIGCGEHGIPGVYVNIPRFRQWIDLKLEGFGINQASYNYA